MRPVLFQFDLLGIDFRFHSYTVALAVGFLAGVLLAVRENYRQPKPYPITPAGGLWVFFPAIFFSKVYYYLQYEPQNVWRAVFLWEGGLVFYGGLLGGALGAIAYLRYHRVPILPVGDIAMTYVPLAHGIARLGCFFNGCCWGAPTGLPWGVHYPHNSMVFRRHVKDGLLDGGAECSLAVHPVQLYESIGLILLFGIMICLYRRPHRTGALLFLYPILYGLLRFADEFARGDVAHALIGLSAAQLFALGMAGFGLAGSAWVRLRAAAPAAESPRSGPEGG